MTRVDENKRAEEDRTQKKHDERRSREQAERFSKLMDAGAQKAQQAARRNASSQFRMGRERARHEKTTGSRMAAANALLARQGIRANTFLEKLQQEGRQRLEFNRDGRAERSEELTEDRLARRAENSEREQEQQIKRRSDRLAAISRDDEKHSGGSDGGEGRPGENDAQQRNHPDLAALMTQKSDGLEGISNAASTSSAAQAHGGATPQQTREVVQEIVKHIMAGLDKKGLGVMHIELRDNVLSGAQLTVKAEEQGLSIRVRTHDDNVARLFSSGQTAQELQGALQNKGILLRTLEVNDEKVIRS